MSDFHCLPGRTVARRLTVSAVTQEALDLAHADLPPDQPCVLFLLHGTSRRKSHGAKLPIAEVRRLIEVLSEMADQANIPPLPTELGPRVYYLRTHIPMTQRVLAERSRCSAPTIANVENGRQVPFNSATARIAIALGVSRGSLIDLAEQMRQRRRGKNKEHAV